MENEKKTREELKEKIVEQLDELSLEDLKKVAGGEISIEFIGKAGNEYSYVAYCPYCSFNIQFPATKSFDEIEDIMTRHIKIYHPTGEPWEDSL